jgi:Protein of unknown function (DUF4238)
VTEKKKNQHYVPRMYLRNFAPGERKAIHLYNISSKQAFWNAPIKSQCSKSYFYGDDLVIENSLDALEGKVTGIIRSIFDSDNVPKPHGEPWNELLVFTLLLHSRTLHAANVHNDIADKLARAILEKDGSLDQELLRNVEISLTNPAAEALRAASLSVFLAMDLTMKVLINRTDVEFITSDNPVVLYNQCFEGANPSTGGNVGLANTGLQIFLPLSGRHLLMLYDRKAYKVGRRKSTQCDVSNRDDVRQFNDLQYLNCVENLYAYSGFKGADIFCLEQRNGNRIRAGLSILDEQDQGTGPDGNTRVRLQITRPDHRIKLSVQPIRQLLRLSKGALNASPKPVRDPKRVRFFMEFRAAVKANRYAPNEINRFIDDRMRAQS